MCPGTGTVDTRKEVLRQVHRVALSRSKGEATAVGRAELTKAVDAWIDEIAKFHSVGDGQKQPDKCNLCGHRFD